MRPDAPLEDVLRRALSAPALLSYGESPGCAGASASVECEGQERVMALPVHHRLPTIFAPVREATLKPRSSMSCPAAPFSIRRTDGHRF